MTKGDQDHPAANAATDNVRFDKETELDALRRLILAPEQDQLREILARLDDVQRQTREVAQVLPGAVRHSSNAGPELESALAPTLEKATHRAIRRDRKAFADALFPVMGPAIRKAISEALRGLVQSLNQALEHSLSWRGLSWRIEALRSGKTFAEVVLSKTLVYRVEQIFLIHQESGLLLLHVVAPEVEAEDADMVSGMLTAIQDFVRDSFKISGDDALQTMEVGDLNVWVERGPKAILAAAILGQAPVDLRHKLRGALESIHFDMADELDDFEGDAAVFEPARPVVEDCLDSQAIEPERRTSPALWFGGLTVAALVLWWLITGWIGEHNLERYVEALRAEPGYVVTVVEGDRFEWTVRGLKDPLARDPFLVADEIGIDRDKVSPVFRGFASLDERMVLARARRVLAPPDSVTLEIRNGLLRAEGRANREWMASARQRATAITGVDSYDESGVVEEKAQDVADRRRREALTERIESFEVHFEVNSARIDEQEMVELDPLIEDILELGQSLESRSKKLAIVVAGHADPSGSRDLNERLSRERADAVWSVLRSRGIPEEWIRAAGRGALTSSAGGGDNLRKVTFSVTVRDTDDQ